jgi:hypothetical protein
MPSYRKKSKSKQTKSKLKTVKPKKKALRGKQAVKPSPPKKRVKKKGAQRKTSSKASAARNEGVRSSWSRQSPASGGGQSEDLQGVHQTEQADSESVAELAEEGNLFEAGAVAGVEEADSADEREVHTHELPEDDVPEEYLDKD